MRAYSLLGLTLGGGGGLHGSGSSLSLNRGGLGSRSGGSLGRSGLHGGLGVLGLVGGLLLLEVLGEELLVSHVGLSGLLPGGNLALLVVGLAAESLLSDESLDLGGLVEGLVTLLDLSADNVLGHIVLLAESEDLTDGAGSLGTESSGLLNVGEASDFAGALLENLEGDDTEVGAADAASDGLSLALTGSGGSVGGDPYNN